MGTCTRLAALASVALATACAGDTAIVLVIEGVDDAARRAVALDVYVGVGRADAPPRVDGSVVEPVWWRQAPVELGEAPLAFPQGLGGDPFELALTPSASLPLDDELVYAVAARDAAGEVVAFAHAEEPLGFGEGQIRRVAVPLQGQRRAGVTATGCAWWRAEPTDVIPGWAKDRAIVPAGDADCDDYRAPDPGEVVDCNPAVDCDDRDPAINPSREPECSDVDVDCCSTDLPDLTDADDDEVPVCAGDCVDSGSVRDLFGDEVAAKDIHPGQVDDTCNGVDEACARVTGGGCDGGVPDRDGDTYVTCRSADGDKAAVRTTDCTWYPNQLDCLEEGSVTDAFGAAHAAVDIHPEAPDVVCDGVDQNCTGTCDDADGDEDADDDGFDRCPASTDVDVNQPTCAAGSSPVDCDDGSFFGQPEPVVERCDGLDSLCDGVAMSSTIALGQCLAVTAGPGAPACTLGRRTCAELFDGTPRFACDTSATSATGVPLRLCEPCGDPTGADPIDCDDGRFRTCHPRTPTGAPGAACGEPFRQVAPLAPCMALSCDWSILAAPSADGWSLGLVDPLALGGSSAPMLTGTRAALRVDAVGPAPRTVVIRRRENSVDHLEFVRLVAESSSSCALMECDAPLFGSR